MTQSAGFACHFDAGKPYVGTDSHIGACEKGFTHERAISLSLEGPVWGEGDAQDLRRVMRRYQSLIIDDPSLIIGDRPLIIGVRSSIKGDQSLIKGDRSLVKGLRPLFNGVRTPSKHHRA